MDIHFFKAVLAMLTFYIESVSSPDRLMVSNILLGLLSRLEE